MKSSRLFSFAFLLVSLTGATGTHAQTVDSVGMNNIIAALNVDFPTSALGFKDNTQAVLNLQGLFDLGYQNSQGLVTFQHGAIMHLYWNKQTADSAAAIMQYVQFTSTGIEVTRGPKVLISEGGFPGQTHETVIVVPDTGAYNGLDFTLTDSLSSGGIPLTGFGAKDFFLDAVVLIQKVIPAAVGDRTTNAASFTSFPNPLLHGSTLTFNAVTQRSGITQVVISDMLGRTIETVSLGNIDAGEHAIKLPFDHAGLFVARLLVDGVQSGPAVKITAE